MPEQNISIPDPFEHLREDHRKIEALMETVSEADEDDAKTREEFFPQIRDTLTLHTELEERYLYPALREFEETRDLAEKAVEDHAEAKNLLREISALKPGDTDWMDRFEELRDAVEAHVQEEEDDLFPLAQETLDKNRIEDLRTKMAELLKSRT
jgi:hemerythrin superfamily protein